MVFHAWCKMCKTVRAFDMFGSDQEEFYEDANGTPYKWNKKWTNTMSDKEEKEKIKNEQAL